MGSVVQWEERDNVAIITVNRPEALNALNAEVMDGLVAAFTQAATRQDLRAIVLTGAGGKAFVAGADIAAMQEFTVLDAEHFARKGQDLAIAVQACPVPVIAAVDGFALGGGCELAMTCDIIVAGPRAKFGQPEVNLGVIPGFGGTQRLVRRVGLAQAMDLCLTGRMVGAAEAVAMGLASRAVEGSAFEGALEIAATIAKKGPVAIRLARRAIHENADADLMTGLAAERTLFAMCFATEDQKEGMKAFVEKRSPAYTGQ